MINCMRRVLGYWEPPTFEVYPRARDVFLTELRGKKEKIARDTAVERICSTQQGRDTTQQFHER